jgi:hypothetical protein
MTASAEICERKVFSVGVRYRLRQAGQVLAGVFFGANDDSPGMQGEIVDVAYRLSTNEWNGLTSVELKIADLRPSGSPETFPSSF